jgi:putative pyruvate formate lyase activating enzyme
MADKIGRIERALHALEQVEKECTLCPRECRVNRRAGEKGICQSGSRTAVSHALLHYGEEPAISGNEYYDPENARISGTPRGSGTIFFAGCNLKCLFCQNYQLSWFCQGKEVGDEELADLMLGLEKRGAYNINLVSPTHLVVPILRALRLAYRKGLSVPLIYNSNGYEKAAVIERLAGIIDIYLPDLKYHAAEVAERFSGAPDYFRHASLCIQEMFVQRPDLVLNQSGIAAEGLIIRHLVLPGQTDNSLAILEWLAHHLPRDISLSLMSQYRPCFRAPREIQRPVRPEEYRRVIARARELGFENLFIQPEEFLPDEHLVPDFERDEPFLWKK